MLQLNDQRSTEEQTKLFFMCRLIIVQQLKQEAFKSFSDFTKRVKKSKCLQYWSPLTNKKPHWIHTQTQWVWMSVTQWVSTKSWPSPVVQNMLCRFALSNQQAALATDTYGKSVSADYSGFNAAASWHTPIWHRRDRAELEYGSSMLRIFSQR